MNGLCVDTFGAGAFMCPTTAFAMQPVPAGVIGNGWVQAVLAPGLAASGSNNSQFGIDVTGLLTDPANLSCGGWRSSASAGDGLPLSVFDPAGNPTFAGFERNSCNAPRPVACCRLP